MKKKEVERMAKYEEWLLEDGLIKLEGYARNGLTDEQIAKNMGINRRTLTDWKKKFAPISLALKRGKEVVDFQVENALLKRALGYSYIKETNGRRLNKETGEYEFVLLETVTVEVPPDVTAQIFWLKNRIPERWRDKKELNLEGKIDTNQELTDEELTEEIKKLKKDLGVGDG